METIDALKAENKCETCRNTDTCGSNSTELIYLDNIDRLLGMGIKAVAIVYACKGYRRR